MARETDLMNLLNKLESLEERVRFLSRLETSDAAHIKSVSISDNIMYAGTPTTNYGTTTSIAVGNQTQKRHSLLKFDLSGLPAAAVVTSVKLGLYVYNVSDLVSTTVSVYRVIRSWEETSSSWNNANTGTAWGTAGCENTTTDRSATSSGSVAITGTGWYDIAINLTEFASMRNANNGFLLKQTGGSSINYKEIYSRENETNNPELIIRYTLGD